jgi:hypothetical protein
MQLLLCMAWVITRRELDLHVLGLPRYFESHDVFASLKQFIIVAVYQQFGHVHEEG